MKSHLSAIINRLEKLIDSGDPKDTFNFEKTKKYKSLLALMATIKSLSSSIQKSKKLQILIASTWLRWKFLI